MFAVGRMAGTNIDRPAMAVIGAVCMFVFGVLSPSQPIASIDFHTLVLLFSMMLIVASLYLAGSFDWIAHKGDRAPRTGAPFAGNCIYQRNSLGLPGERYRLPGNGTFGGRHLQTNGTTPSRLFARPGNGVEHR